MSHRSAVAALAVLAALLLAGAPDPLPVMTNGSPIAVYAPVTDPVHLSVAPDGTIYTGRDLSGSGGNAGGAAKIHRITPGDPPVVEELGPAIDDADAVIFDAAGFSGVANAVLVGGRIDNIFAGNVVALDPAGASTPVVTSNTTLQNPSGFSFDSTGVLWTTSFGNARLVKVAPGGAVTSVKTLPAGPLDIVVEPATDHLFVSLEDGRIQIYDAAGTLLDADFATGRPTAFGTGSAAWGDDLYAVDNTTGTLSRVDAAGAATVIGTGFQTVYGLDFGPDDALYLTEFDDDRVLRVPEAGAAGAALAAWIALTALRRRSSRKASRAERPTAVR